MPSRCLRYGYIDDGNNGTGNEPYCTITNFNRSQIERCDKFVYATEEVNLINEVSKCHKLNYVNVYTNVHHI